MTGDETSLRVVIADDEALALEGIADLVRSDAHFNVVATAVTGTEALGAIRTLRPDVAILDIRMPGLTGLEVLSALEAAECPEVVFITAYNRFAVDAFEAAAIDYVLKPFTDDRLFAALARAKERRAERTARLKLEEISRRLGRLPELLAHPAFTRSPDAATSRIQRLMVREAGKVRVIRVNEIDWIEGADYYARLHLGARAILIRESLGSLEQRLEARQFFRVSKSAIVNLDRVVELRSDARSDFLVVLSNGTRIKLGRGKRPRFEVALASFR